MQCAIVDIWTIPCVRILVTVLSALNLRIFDIHPTFFLRYFRKRFDILVHPDLKFGFL